MNWQVLWHPFAAGDLVALWSLAIEEQFYFVWPLMVVAFLGIRKRVEVIAPALAVAFVVVTFWRVVVFHRWGWESAYLRTDTRVDGLLAGSLVASLYVRGLTPARLPRWTPWVVLAAWAILLATVEASGAFAYQGGITLWIVASATMILYLVSEPAQPERRRHPVIRAVEIVGIGSYANYL